MKTIMEKGRILIEDSTWMKVLVVQLAANIQQEVVTVNFYS